MAWPSPVEYVEALQNPRSCFRDLTFQRSHVTLDSMGLPRIASGNFACVFQLNYETTRFAVRCFTKQVIDQDRHYTLLGQHLSGFLLRSLAEFEYLTEGVIIGGSCFPIVKMEWVEGETLDIFVKNHLREPETLRRLAAQWRGLLAGLRGANMAHGDLQHGNILVDKNGWMRLVDYDAMFIPVLRGEKSPELGHPNYQHPDRAPEQYDQGIDNFAAFVVYLSLIGLASDPGLWADFNSGDNLVLTKADYMDIPHSDCAKRLLRSSDITASKSAVYLERICSTAPSKVPDLESIIEHLNVAACPEPLATQAAVVPVRGSRSSESVSAMITCPKCAYGNPASLIYCARCATQISGVMRKCTHCGQLAPALAAFCRNCGGRQKR